MKKTGLFIILILFLSLISFSPTYSTVVPGDLSIGKITLEYRNVTVYAPAVAQTEQGYVGVISTITVTIQNNGSGRVFVDTLPLTQIDMQGSARLAMKVANGLVKKDESCPINPSEYDYFFVVRTTAPIIGGPSAGAIMTVAVVSLLQNWTLDNKTVMTGMINPDGSIGPIGGITQKIDAAASVGATRFLIPKGQGVYTETITDTTIENGWTTIIQKQVTRNVSDYAAETYGIEVVEVEDINDALLYFTGYTFSNEESPDKITTEKYIDAMKPSTQKLLNESRLLYQNAHEAFNNSQIPNYYPYYYRNQVTDILNQAHENLLDSQNWFNQDLFYTSTSNSFQSLIDSRFVTYACEYFTVDNPEEYVTKLLNQAISFKNNKTELAKNESINGMITLQCIGAAQKRVSDAETNLNDAQQLIQNNQEISALYNIAYAMERSKSISWWLNISTFFNDTGNITATELNTLANEYIEDAQQAITYSTLILSEIATTSNYLTDAEDLLQSARNNYEQGYPAAAFFEALETLVKANLALELVDSTSKERIDRTQESASNSITETRNRGIEPVLAISYYEFAQSLVNESSYDAAILYYRYSDLIAGSLGLTGTCGGQTSRYIGIPTITITTNFTTGISRYFEYFIFIAFIGLLFGLGIGIIIGSTTGKKQHRQTQQPPQERTPRSVNEYYKKQHQQQKEPWQPKSIHDYYKKNK